MKTKPQKSAYLTTPVMLQETGTPMILRMVSVFTSLVLICFIVWTIITKLDEVAVAQGEIITSAHVQEIQHLQGGIIKEILVENGELVKKGTVLITLDPLVAKSQLEQSQAKYQGLLFNKERLEASLEERLPDFRGVAGENIKLALEQERLYTQLMRSKTMRRDLLRNQIELHHAELQELDIRAKKTARQKEFLVEEIDIRKGLVEKGLNSKIQFLSLQRKLSDLDGELDVIPASRKKLTIRIAEAEKKLEEQESKDKEALMKELAGVHEQIVQLNEVLKRNIQGYEHTSIIAPITGYVHGLNKHTVGGVISGGSKVMEIIPYEEVYEAKVQISSKDIGHVSVGQPVTMKFTTYDFMRYGGMKGELIKISNSTVTDDGAEPYYKGIVAMKKNYFGDDPSQNPILPGMTITADIKTGSKSIMEYLLKPIFVSSRNAMRER